MDREDGDGILSPFSGFPLLKRFYSWTGLPSAYILWGKDKLQLKGTNNLRGEDLSDYLEQAASIEVETMKMSIVMFYKEY